METFQNIKLRSKCSLKTMVHVSYGKAENHPAKAIKRATRQAEGSDDIRALVVIWVRLSFAHNDIAMHVPSSNAPLSPS